MKDLLVHFSRDASWPMILAGIGILVVGFLWGAWILRKETLSARFRALLFALRIVSFLLLLLLLAPLIIKFRYTLSNRPSVLVLVDDSQSMSLGAANGSRPRIERAIRALHGELPSLRRRFQVEIARFGGPDIQPIARIDDELRATSDTTDLASALTDARRWYSGRSLDAVLIVSDGRITAGGSPKVAAGALGVPVFTAGFDEATAREAARDLAIIGIDAPRIGLAGNTVRVVATLRATGLEPAKHSIEIVEGKRVVAQGEAVFQKDQRETRADLAFVAEREGYHVYTVRATPVAKEQVTRNNEFAFGLNVENAKRRVCMIESVWRAEYRYIKRAIEEDPNLKFSGFLRVKEGQFKEQVEPTEVASPLPETLRDFDYYDTVILGDVNPLTLPARFTRLLSDFVSEQGGGLIVTGGASVFGPDAARDADLLALLPVTLGPDTRYMEVKYPILLTPEGAQSPVFNIGVDWIKNRAIWHSLPELSTLCLFQRAKPGATVLAVDPQLANEFGPRIVAAYQQFGKGRVLVLGTDSTWNWAFQESRPGFDMVHEQFWRQAVRFVGRRPEINTDAQALRPSKEIVYEGDTVRLRLVLPPEMVAKSASKVSGELTGPDDKKQPLTFISTDASNVVWEAKFTAVRTGPYQATATVSVGDAALRRFDTTVCAQGGSPEFENTAVNNALLKDLAESTGGKFAYVSDLGSLVKAIQPARHPEERVFEWNSSSSRWLAAIILALWATEWMARKLKNLA